jgi:hypothetical protein
MLKVQSCVLQYTYLMLVFLLTVHRNGYEEIGWYPVRIRPKPFENRGQNLGFWSKFFTSKCVIVFLFQNRDLIHKEFWLGSLKGRYYRNT